MLDIFYGCMFAGKTTLANTITQKTYKHQYLYFDLADTELRNIQAIQENILSHSLPLSCIVIDEFQFIHHDSDTDIDQLIRSLSDFHIILALLDMDCFGKEFPAFTSLKNLYEDTNPVAFKHLKGKCNYCENESLHSSRISHHTEQIVLDKDLYKPTCKECFEKNLLEKKTSYSARLTITDTSHLL